MKNHILVFSFLLMSFLGYAQDDPTNKTQDNKKENEVQTLFGKNQKTHNGFYFAPVVRLSAIDNEFAVLPGFKGAWTINRSVSLGFEGYGLAPTITRSDITEDFKVRSLMGYGGFFIEPIIQSNKLVHLTLPLMFGAGWFGYIEDWSNQGSNHYNHDDLVDDQVFWVIEPGANVEMNIASFFRVGLGASYRFTQDLEMLNTPKNALRGASYSLTLKFGKF